MGSGGRQWLAVLISVVIGAGFLALAARDLEFDQIGDYLRSVDPVRLGGVLLVYGGLYTVVHVLRMWRWTYLVRHLGDFSTGDVMRAAAIGFTAIVVMPLRLGELVRPYVLARDTGCSMSAALGTAVVERVMDGLFITLLLFLTLLSYDGDGNVMVAMGMGYVCLAIFSGALGVCLAALWRRQWTLRWLDWIFSKIHVRLRDVLLGLLEAFLDGIESLREGRALGSFLAVTVVYWGLNGVSIAFLASYGFDLGLGPWQGLTVLAILVVGLMIPAGPGLAGNYELFALEALALFVPQGQVAVAGAAMVGAMHLVQFVVQVIPGFVCLWSRPGESSLLSLQRQSSQRQ